MVLLALQLFYNLVGLLGHLLIYILALLVIFINVVSLGQCLLKVLLDQQIDGLCSILHTA